MTIVYIDASASLDPKQAAGAAVFKEEDRLIEHTTFLGTMDNHEAEWATLLFTAEKAVEHGFTSLIIYTDSKIISDSFDKGYVKHPLFKQYFKQINRLQKHFQLFLISLTPRKQNKQADRLAKERLYKERTDSD
ncbi:ribonuclease HI family protein [Salinicoccus albus]|uniref:ribonuclease HI family protein n=1 Tax=Salinicoccus albus TaxID=418756 RepID=UPI00035ECA90|nr:ribonuclease HI family protein [Salinicoccus albus]